MVSQNLSILLQQISVLPGFFGGGLGGDVQKSPSSICTKIAIVS